MKNLIAIWTVEVDVFFVPILVFLTELFAQRILFEQSMHGT